MRFCVIGAGSGGRAFAAYVASKGHDVSLYNRSYYRIADIKRKGGIEAFGALEGFYSIDLITHNIGFALNDSDIILVVTPASAHKSIAKSIAPFLRDGQVIFLNPGRTFGAVEVHRVLEKKRPELSVFIAEAQTLLFTCRADEENGVNILKIKDSVNFATFPDKYVHDVCDIIEEVFPQLHPIDDYLEVTLNNIGMLLHPAITLFNAGMMDYGKEFKFYSEGATSKVCQVLEMIELEINTIFNLLGIQQLRFHKWASKSYGIEANSIHEAIQKIGAYKPVKAPDQLITRYLTEDVPTGLVPISSLGTFLNVETPTIDSIIYLTSLLCGIEFKKNGRTMQELDLYDYFIDHMKNIQIREEEKEGLFSIERILNNYHEFKVCLHCGKINYHKNNLCWVCRLKDFRSAKESDLTELQSQKEKTIIRA